MHTVPGDRNTCRTIDFVCIVDFVPSLTWKENVAALPLLNVTVAVPTGVRVTASGLNGTAENGGPDVRINVPE